MTIKEYIIKNLPNFNWNILPQIFAENGVEMNEEIEVYLKETPGNTNWNITKQLFENDKQVVFSGTIVTTQIVYNMGSSYVTGLIPNTLVKGAVLELTINNTVYKLPRNTYNNPYYYTGSEYNGYYYGTDEIYPGGYPKCINNQFGGFGIMTDGTDTLLVTTEPGTYNIIIKETDENTFSFYKADFSIVNNELSPGSPEFTKYNPYTINNMFTEDATIRVIFDNQSYELSKDDTIGVIYGGHDGPYPKLDDYPFMLECISNKNGKKINIYAEDGSHSIDIIRFVQIND